MTPAGVEMLKGQEGYRSHIYFDSRRFHTIGYGTNLDVGITQTQAAALLTLALDDKRKSLESLVWYNTLDLVRQDVIENMAYNMGITALAGFRKMIDAVMAEDWDTAADQMKQSIWAEEVGNRAVVLAEIMRVGAYPA